MGTILKNFCFFFKENMSELPTSVSSYQVNDRFVSEKDIEEARERGEELVKEKVDRRPLSIQLAEQKALKDEEFKEKFKNRPPKAVDEEEGLFYEELQEKKRKIDAMKDEELRKEIQAFREAVENQVIDRTKPIETNETKEPAKKKRPSIGEDLMPHERQELFAINKPIALAVKPKLKTKPKAKKQKGAALSLLGAYDDSDDES